jgi:ketosteroid isomerase-like protein
MTATIQQIATRFANAVKGAGDPDFAELFAPKVVVGHVYDEQVIEIDAADIVKGTLNDEPGFKRLMSDYRPSDIRVFYGEDGFAIARTVSGTLADGTKITYPFCAVATVKNGKIVRIDAYQDRQQAAPLGAAMQALHSSEAAE